MRSWVIAGSIVVVAAALGACSSSSDSGSSGDAGDSGGTPVTADQACTDAIAALCGEVQKCSPFLFDVSFGDMPTCTSRLVIGCSAGFGLNGNKSTPDQLEACGKAVPNVTCSAFLEGLDSNGLRNALASQSACDPVAGTLANGTACGNDGQCTSAFCAVAGDAYCGTCAAPPAAGDACISGKCGAGLICSTAGKCEKPGVAGDACTDSADCASTFQCFNAKCTAKGGAGAACDANPASTTAPDCDATQGVICAYDKTTFKPTTCVKATEAKVGDPCSFLDQKICTGGAYCKGYDIKNPTVPGTCTAPADDGAACDAAAGPTCKPGAKCIAGICKTNDPTSCK